MGGKYATKKSQFKFRPPGEKSAHEDQNMKLEQ